VSGGYPWRTRDWPIYVASALPILGALLLLAAEIPARVLGGAWLPITGSDWLVHAAGIVRHPLRPAATWTSQAGLAPGPVAYYATLVGLITAIALPVLLVVRARGRRGQPGGDREPLPRQRQPRPGFAGKKELRATLDGRAAHRIELLSEGDVVGVPVGVQTRNRPPGSHDERAVHLGRDLVTGNVLWGTWEDSYCVLGAPRQGKGLGFLVKLLATWPGPFVAPSTKPDNLLHSALSPSAADRRLYVFDATRMSGWAPSARWSPVAGCHEADVAALRAEALVFAAPPDPSVRGGRFWTDSAAAVLRCYLHAAALAEVDIRTVLGWTRRHEVEEPAKILRRSAASAAEGWVDALEGVGRLPNETRGSVFGQLGVSLGFLATPTILEACCPDRAHPALDPERLIEDRGRLYVLGTAAGQRSMAPLVAALVETVADVARRRAARSRGGRLSPPLGLFIDEAAQIAPLPTLPSLLADGGGQGITTVVVLQSLGQARERWGDDGATAMWDACSAKLVFGGLSSHRDLEAIARLSPEIDEPVPSRSRSRDGWSESTTTRRAPALTPADVREIPRWQALLLYPGLRPVLTLQRPWWEEPRYARLIHPAREAIEDQLNHAS